MTILFYRWDKRETPPPRLPLPPGLEVRAWRPARDGLPPPGARSARNLAWWAIDALGLFARRDFTEISIWRAGRRLHRLVVTPRWFRFPFMGPADLQLGDLWTDPEGRRSGLAQIAIGEAHQGLADDVAAVWYLAPAENIASTRLIQGASYRYIGAGIRSRPLGLRLLGRYRLSSPAT